MQKLFSRKNHVIATRFPIISAIIWIFIGIYVPTTLAATIMEPFYDSYHDVARIFLFLLVIIISMVSLILFDKWFSPEYESALTGKGLAYGFALSVPVIVFMIAYRVFKIAMGYEIYESFDLDSLLMGSRAGFGEEIFFRGIAVALLLRRFKDEKNIWFPPVFTGIFFGLTHLTNVSALADFANVWLWLNTVFASVFGIIFGVIFTLSGNIWPCIILHTLYDALTFSVSLTDDSPDILPMIEIGVYFVFALVYLYLMMKNRQKASLLWNEKWQLPKQ